MLKTNIINDMTNTNNNNIGPVGLAEYSVPVGNQGDTGPKPPFDYLPVPPRAWSRVDTPCVYTDPGPVSPVYVPLTGQTIPLEQAILEEKNLYKGNILQYKNNSSQLTKKQKYAQISKGLGPSRKKVYATQTQTYTNPNMTGLLRVNYQTLPFPNQIVSAPNNISGPFQYNVPNPFGCDTNSVQDGGNLVCGTYANPCSGEIIKTAGTDPLCFPNSCSDVPGGPTLLCWNNKIQTFFPRQRYFMNNSANKWPQGYKGFVSAARPSPPSLSIKIVVNTITLSWTFINSPCLPISSFNIYQDGLLLINVPYTVTSYSTLVFGVTLFHVTSLSGNIESLPSNTVNN